MDNEKIEEFKVQNCFLLRQLLTTLITVLSGGLAGLLLVERTILGAIIFIVGLFFLGVFIASLKRTIIELNGYLYGKQRRKND